MSTTWKITYTENGQQHEEIFYAKLAAVKAYINTIGKSVNICELAIYKNDVDYTATVNKFLYH